MNPLIDLINVSKTYHSSSRPAPDDVSLGTPAGVVRKGRLHRLQTTRLTVKVSALRWLALLCLTLLPAVAHAGPAPSAGTESMVLRLGDVPSGFAQTAAQPLSLPTVATMNHVDAAALRSEGFVTSYETEFRRSAPSGLVDIVDDVVLYRTTAGERWQMARSRVVAKQVYPQLQPLALGRIGNRAVGGCSQQSVNGASYTTCFVLVRHGRCGAYVAVAGRTGTFDPAIVIGYARTMNRRIAAQLGAAR